MLQFRSLKSNDTNNDILSSKFLLDSPSSLSDDSENKYKVDLIYNSPSAQKVVICAFKSNSHQHEEETVSYLK